jgi:hypothetical protein
LTPFTGSPNIIKAEVMVITPHTRQPAADSEELCDFDENKHTVPYNVKVRVRLISLFIDTDYNKSLGVLHGPVDGHEWTPTSPGHFLVELDSEDDLSDDSDSSKAPGGGDKFLVYSKNFEVVGKVEQRTALLRIVENRELRYEVLKAFIKSGCSMKEVYPEVESGNILFFPAFSGDKEMLEVLIKLNAPVAVKNSAGYTAVMIAASQGKSACIRVLKDGGADLDVRNDVGWTALLVAASADKPKAVNMLLQLGADPSLCNNYSKNSYDIAVDKNHQKVIDVLRLHGVQPSALAVKRGDANKVINGGGDSSPPKQTASAASPTQAALAQQPVMSPVTQPTEWIRHIDPASGAPYWENQITFHTQWENPNPKPKAGRRGSNRRRSFNGLGSPEAYVVQAALSPAANSPTGYGGYASTSTVGEDSLDSLSSSVSSSVNSPLKRLSSLNSPTKDELQQEQSGIVVSQSVDNLAAGITAAGSSAGPRRSSFRNNRNVVTQAQPAKQQMPAQQQLAAESATDALFDDSYLRKERPIAEEQVELSEETQVASSVFAELVSMKKEQNVRRAPESVKQREIREKNEWEQSLEYKRYQLELERLHMKEDQRHQSKAIDADKFTGTWSRDKTRRRSFA